MDGVSEFIFPDHDPFFVYSRPSKRVCREAPSPGSSLSSSGGSYDLATKEEDVKEGEVTVNNVDLSDKGESDGESDALLTPDDIEVDDTA